MNSPQNPITLTDASTITWNYLSGFNAQVSIGAAGRTLNVTGMTAGDYGTLLITQGVAGSTITNFPSGSKFPGNTYSFSTLVNRSDLYGFYYNGSNFYWTFNLNYV